MGTRLAKLVEIKTKKEGEEKHQVTLDSGFFILYMNLIVKLLFTAQASI